MVGPELEGRSPGTPTFSSIERLLTAPPSLREIIEEAEGLVFTD